MKLSKFMLPLAMVAGLVGGVGTGMNHQAMPEKTIIIKNQARIERKRKAKKTDSHGLSPVGGCAKKSIAARRRRQGYDAYSQGEFIKKADVKRKRVASSRFNDWRYGLIWQYETHATRLAVGWR